jgi:hypothetical protein
MGKRGKRANRSIVIGQLDKILARAALVVAIAFDGWRFCCADLAFFKVSDERQIGGKASFETRPLDVAGLRHYAASPCCAAAVAAKI